MTFLLKLLRSKNITYERAVFFTQITAHKKHQLQAHGDFFYSNHCAHVSSIESYCTAIRLASYTQWLFKLNYCAEIAPIERYCTDKIVATTLKLPFYLNYCAEKTSLRSAQFFNLKLLHIKSTSYRCTVTFFTQTTAQSYLL